MMKYWDKDKILARVKFINSIKNSVNFIKQGEFEMELDMLWIEFLHLENPHQFDTTLWSKHQW